MSNLAGTVAEGIAPVRILAPAFVVADMRLDDGNGLEAIEALHRRYRNAHGIAPTGYGTTASAVTAVKPGAIDSLAKPADADEIGKALMANPRSCTDPPDNPISAERVRREHTQRVYGLCDLHCFANHAPTGYASPHIIADSRQTGAAPA